MWTKTTEFKHESTRPQTDFAWTVLTRKGTVFTYTGLLPITEPTPPLSHPHGAGVLCIPQMTTTRVWPGRRVEWPPSLKEKISDSNSDSRMCPSTAGLPVSCIPTSSVWLSSGRDLGSHRNAGVPFSRVEPVTELEAHTVACRRHRPSWGWELVFTRRGSQRAETPQKDKGGAGG